MQTKDERTPREETIELDGNLARSFESNVWDAISSKLEPLRKLFGSLMLIFICWACFQLFTMVKGLFSEVDRQGKEQDRQSELQRQSDSKISELVKSVDEMKLIPGKVAALEKRSDSIEEAQRQSDRNQGDILKQLSQLQGFLQGLNTNRKEPVTQQ